MTVGPNGVQTLKNLSLKAVNFQHSWLKARWHGLAQLLFSAVCSRKKLVGFSRLASCSGQQTSGPLPDPAPQVPGPDLDLRNPHGEHWRAISMCHPFVPLGPLFSVPEKSFPCGCGGQNRVTPKWRKPDRYMETWAI